MKRALLWWLDEIADSRQVGWNGLAVYMAVIGVVVTAAFLCLVALILWGLATLVLHGHFVELAVLAGIAGVLGGIGYAIHFATDPSFDRDRERQS